MPRLQSRETWRPSFRPAARSGRSRAHRTKDLGAGISSAVGGLADPSWAQLKDFALEKGDDEYPTFLEALVLGEMLLRRES